ncbi:TetR/AcrR family transcriptional regulator [Rhizomonospora bruguierae]|uniref:TetR/AcrR family transcriptional regulator n=1 Tax=Rhizomonospora bruguierae TaxID=1581705 RepID=UPI001BCC72F8|nr:TetR/AcrR family transcriptional regulator [Micromonospora sp. NBRC 107566]
MTTTVRRGYAKGRARRREILDRAVALFGEVGYRGASLREIAARCGLSHPGLLHHFPTKEALLLAALRHRDEVDGERFAATGTGAQVLLRLVDLVRLNADRRGIVELFTVLSAEATAPDHPAHAYFAERYRHTVEAIERSYARARAEGTLRPGIDPGAAARHLVALMDGLQIQWLLDDRATDMAAVVEAHVRAQLTAPHQPAPRPADLGAEPGRC